MPRPYQNFAKISADELFSPLSGAGIYIYKMSEFDVGSVIDNRFQIVSRLGEGGMGVVYEALHQEMNRTVALKVLKAVIDREPEKLARFRNEAQVMSSLQHPNIVSVYSIGLAESGSPYIAMELLSGRSLSSIIREDGPLPYTAALPLFMQLCDALQHAHALQVIHRDIKPSNLIIEMRDGEPQLKVLDFGIAKVLGSEQQLTATTALVGSVFYMSPGQCEGRSVDVRSDIYSLGCTMFETLAGCPPFNPDSLAELVVSHRDRVPPRVNELNAAANIPQSLERLLACCLEKDERHRYQSMAELRADLRQVASGDSPRHIPEKQTGLPAPSRTSNPRRGRWPIVLLTVLCMVALMVPVVTFVTRVPDKLPEDPYANFGKDELLLREQQLLTQEDSLHHEEKFAEMEKVMAEADRLKPYLKMDPDLQARIDGKRGALTYTRARDSAVGQEQHDLLIDCQSPLELAIKEYDQARLMFGMRHDTHSRKRVQRMLGEESHNLTFLRESAQMLKQRDKAESAAEKMIQLSKAMDMPMEYGESERCQKAYLYLIEAGLLRKQPEPALNWTRQLMHFYKLQEFDKEYAVVKKETILALWEKYCPQRRADVLKLFKAEAW